MRTIGAWIWSRAWIVLVYMAVVSGANGTAARLAAGQMSPLVLVFMRWFAVCIALACLLDREQRLELSELLLRRWRRLAWMGLLGYTGFNSLFYIAAYHTSAVNLTLLQSVVPPLVLIGAAVVFKTPIQAFQVIGMILTFAGVLIVAAKGDLTRLSALRLDIGDLFVLIACVFYACYTLGLRARPSGSPIVFFAGMAFAALLWSIPAAATEIVSGHAYWPSLQGWAVTAFIAFGPSFTGQLCYMRGVDLIGPGRAGLFANLIPIFGALSAVLVLHETFMPSHAIALLLGLGGVTLAEWPNVRPRQVVSPRPLKKSAHPRLP